jgi:hypothetical protein
VCILKEEEKKLQGEEKKQRQEELKDIAKKRMEHDNKEGAARATAEVEATDQAEIKRKKMDADRLRARQSAERAKAKWREDQETRLGADQAWERRKLELTRRRPIGG